MYLECQQQKTICLLDYLHILPWIDSMYPKKAPGCWDAGEEPASWGGGGVDPTFTKKILPQAGQKQKSWSKSSEMEGVEALYVFAKRKDTSKHLLRRCHLDPQNPPKKNTCSGGYSPGCLGKGKHNGCFFFATRSRWSNSPHCGRQLHWLQQFRPVQNQGRRGVDVKIQEV